MTELIGTDLSGQTLADRYRLVTRIGGGGMAEVYEAKDLDLNRTVAVKVSLPYLANDPDFAGRLRAEAAVMSGLQHPGIVRLYDYGEAGGRSFLVMEMVRGPSLLAVMDREGVLPPGRALRVTDGLLAALQHAHESGVLHRDIKPGNVLLTARGRPKLADFGIATAGASSGATNPGHVVGSVHYLSPERAAGATATPSSDLYSVGVLLYLMLVGRLPFEGETTAEIAARQASGRPMAPSEARAGLPKWLDGVVLRALASEPGDRYDSASEMRAEIRRLAASVHGDATAEMAAVPLLGNAARAGIPGGAVKRALPRIAYAVLAAMLLGTILLLETVSHDASPPSHGQQTPSVAVPAPAPSPVPTAVPAPTPATATPAPEVAPPQSSSPGVGPQGSGPPGQANKPAKGNGRKKQ